jgi:VanZ family protein
VFLIYWLPVLVWLAVIFTESMSPFAASDQTSRIVIPVLRWLMPHAGMETLETIHHLLRKIGHFTGYGLLGYLFFRAFRAMHHLKNSTVELLTRAYRKSRGAVFSEYWRAQWFFLAMLGTFIVASADELHQMTLVNRTGSWWDVLLDCLGGLVFQILLLVFWKIRARSGRTVAARAEA